ncbi:MAG TPA: serine/threonine-protein kinase [Urbifossiella sp.]|jgi:serine/threonine protein kinase|nr:serine/threonine-protein kinase [Urbifossiella sp.]
MTTTPTEFLGRVRKSGLLEPARLDAYLSTRPCDDLPLEALAARMQADGLLTPFQAAQLLRGKSRRFVLGRYKVLDRIGLGGMGEVFLAEHLDMRRRAAVKVLPRALYDSSFARERFLREARAAGQLDHPNVVRAYDVGEDRGVIYLVMEFVDGVSWHDLVTQHGPLPPDRVAHYLLQAARGLGYLAERGLVHRDIKPSNILVDRAGVVKILDLGLVRSEDETDELTCREGITVLGTADYQAPEQAMSSRVDARADLYALGATGFFLLSGKPPFHAATSIAQKMIAHQLKPAPRVGEVRPGVPEELADAIARMLAKKPADRFQSADQVIAALGRWAEVPSGPGPVIPEAVGGLVDLSPPRSVLSGGSSLSLGAKSSDGPTPGPVGEATPAPRADMMAALRLPASFTHGMGDPVRPAELDGEVEREKVQPPTAAEPEEDDPELPVRWFRGWVAPALVFVFSLAAAALALVR